MGYTMSAVLKRGIRNSETETETETGKETETEYGIKYQ